MGSFTPIFRLLNPISGQTSAWNGFGLSKSSGIQSEILKNVDFLTFLMSRNVVKVLQIMEFRGILAVWQQASQNHGFW